jgi:hypothetical protein
MLPVAILGAALFAGEAPDDFATFARAFVALLRAASGDRWPKSLALAHESGGMNWPACLYMGVFVVATIWFALEVGGGAHPALPIPPFVVGAGPAQCANA